MNGRELCAAFYNEAVRPLLRDVPHSAGLLGPGSEVLGFDDDISTDHHFGPRVLLFLGDADIGTAEEISVVLARGLDPAGEPINHRVEIRTVSQWTTDYLGFDATRTPTVQDWLASPTQLLATVVDAAVYHDGLNQLRPIQERLRWYPDDVWRYVLGAQWRRISQEDHFVGRTASVGDDLGSRVLAARLVRDLIRLAFLIERRWAPYAKWLGSSFRQLGLASDVGSALDAALAAPDYPSREAALARAYEVAMQATSDLGVAAEFPTSPAPFYNRGFLVTFGERIAAALRAHVTDPDVLALDPYLGAVDQFVDSTDVLSREPLLRRVRHVIH